MIYHYLYFILSGLIGIQTEQKNVLFNETITLIQKISSWGEVMSDSIRIGISYDPQNLYLSLEAYQDTSTIISYNSTRDNGADQDFCGFVIDPFGTSQEGYMFLFGAGGNLLDARILKSTGGTEEYSWDSDVSYITQRTDYGYRIDAVVPFSNFRRSGSSQQRWIINIVRKKQSTNEVGLYRLTESWQANHLFKDGIEIFLQDIGTREPINIIPYGIWGGEVDEGVESEKGDAGFDVRIPLGSSSVVNLAINPDFNQLEEDPLQFDFNTKYAIYYSEYRPFFLEERGIFRTYSEVFYSRRIYNPFLAARYTFKTSINQFGLIVAWDEKDTAIGNPDAYTGLGRYKRFFGQNYFGVMILGKQNGETEDINYIFMTDGDITFLGDMLEGAYACAMSKTSEEGGRTDTTGYFYESEIGCQRGNLKLTIFNAGITNTFNNKLGFTPVIGFQSMDLYFDYSLNFNKPVLKKISLGFYPGASGTWDKFWRNLSENFDSLEYSQSAYMEIDMFKSFDVYFWFLDEKSEYLGNYYFVKGLETGISFDIASNHEIWMGNYTGYALDYNLGRLCKKYSYWGGLSGNIFEKLTYTLNAEGQQFYGDTSGFAIKPSDIKNVEWQWTAYKPFVQLILTPDNRYSLSITYQKLWTNFASYYWTSENYDNDDDNFFALLTFKPSTGDVIYFGIRFPEKLVFFKFSHRFEF